MRKYFYFLKTPMSFSVSSVACRTAITSQSPSSDRLKSYTCHCLQGEISVTLSPPHHHPNLRTWIFTVNWSTDISELLLSKFIHVSKFNNLTLITEHRCYIVNDRNRRIAQTHCAAADELGRRLYEGLWEGFL